jgi:hypothetical protein|tara:strand:- start:729 stop:1049 length:321 start_codon:yes stop_codon:yes gene_type:complete
MAVRVIYDFIYGKNFFDNPDREYTDLNEFKTVNDYDELSTFLAELSNQYPFETDVELSANKKIMLQKVTFSDELDHINAKGAIGRIDMFSSHNVIGVTEELYLEYK